MLKSPIVGAREPSHLRRQLFEIPCPGPIHEPEDLMKTISVLALGGIIALFGLTRIGAAADSRDNNASVSERFESNSSGDSLFRVTYPRSGRVDTGVESKGDYKRDLDRYKWITPGNSEYNRKDRLNPLTLYAW
jgi:hypothetical protein